MSGRAPKNDLLQQARQLLAANTADAVPGLVTRYPFEHLEHASRRIIARATRISP